MRRLVVSLAALALALSACRTYADPVPEVAPAPDWTRSTPWITQEDAQERLDAAARAVLADATGSYRLRYAGPAVASLESFGAFDLERENYSSTTVQRLPEGEASMIVRLVEGNVYLLPSTPERPNTCWRALTEEEQQTHLGGGVQGMQYPLVLLSPKASEHQVDARGRILMDAPLSVVLSLAFPGLSKSLRRQSGDTIDEVIVPIGVELRGGAFYELNVATAALLAAFEDESVVLTDEQRTSFEELGRIDAVIRYEGFGEPVVIKARQRPTSSPSGRGRRRTAEQPLRSRCDVRHVGVGKASTSRARATPSGVKSMAKKPITLTVDGVSYSDDVEPRTLLVQYLREQLGKTGTLVGCDTTNCGACTVHLDGRSVKSCTMFAVQADGHDVTTIEGIASEDGTLHPMQQAFHESHALQCGFCTPGMIMQSIDLATEHPDPDEATVRENLEGNLCRCTGYQNIVKAVQAGAKEMSGRTGAPADEAGAA